jgi:hypothetical protein
VVADITTTGTISPGVHQCSVIFVTRQGYWTAPSPPISWTAAGGKKAIVTNIPTGPSNVVQRLLAAMAFHAWLTEHDDRLRLQATINTQKQALDAADIRERDRAVTLKDTLAQIEALKRHTQSPTQILDDLPKYLPLPEPITLTSPQSVLHATQQGTAQPGTGKCAEKKGCPATAPQSFGDSAAEGSPKLEPPAAAT